MKTADKLQKLWEKKHLNHLIYCLENHKDFYLDSFVFNGLNKGNDLIINERIITQEEVIQILALYYEDNIISYETPFGDFIYLVFTDMASDDVLILNELE